MSERVLICGDRNWGVATSARDVVALYQTAVLHNFVESLPSDAIVIEGEARGADRAARGEAETRGLIVLRFPADWQRYGRAAGPIRNQQMLDEGKPTRCVAFHDDMENSKGTADMVRRCRKAGVPVEVITSG